MTPHPAGAQREALRLAYAALTAPETSIGGWYAHSVTGVLPVIREALAAADGSVPGDGGEALRREVGRLAVSWEQSAAKTERDTDLPQAVRSALRLCAGEARAALSAVAAAVRERREDDGLSEDERRYYAEEDETPPWLVSLLTEASAAAHGNVSADSLRAVIQGVPEMYLAHAGLLWALPPSFDDSAPADGPSAAAAPVGGRSQDDQERPPDG